MARAIASISHTTAIIVLARQRAIKAVKAAMQRKGLKPQYVARREIVAAAEEYLALHRAVLINEARETVERWEASILALGRDGR